MRGVIKFYDSENKIVFSRKYSGKEERKCLIRTVLSENNNIDYYQITPILPRLGLDYRNALRKIKLKKK